jgi:hypothetical protein
VGPVQIALTVPRGVLGRRRGVHSGAEEVGVKAFTWAALPTSPMGLCILFPSRDLVKGHLSVHLAWCERKHCPITSLLPPSQTLGPSWAQSQRLWHGPYRDLLSLGTAALGSGSCCLLVSDNNWYPTLAGGMEDMEEMCCGDLG